MTTMRDYAEKRDFIRMKVDAEIELSDEKSGLRQVGTCKDLSGTGMAIEVAEPFHVGSELKTSLPSNNTSFPSFDTIVKVNRCEPSQDKYLIGVEIVKVNS